MEKKQEQRQESKKNEDIIKSEEENIFEKETWLNKYKRNLIRKTEKELESYKENSPTKILYDRWINVGLDIIGWGIIAFFVYIWWTTQAQQTILTCSDISVDMCNKCFTPIKEVIGGLT